MDLTFGCLEKFGVPRPVSVLPRRIVGHEASVFRNNEMLQVQLFERAGDGPAALEIGFTVDVVVVRAGEGEVLCEQHFKTKPVGRQVAIETAAYQFLDGSEHGGVPRTALIGSNRT